MAGVGRSTGHDLIFTVDGVKYQFNLYTEGKDPPLSVVATETSESTANFLKRGIPRIWQDFSGGSFYSLSPQIAAPPLYSTLASYAVAPSVYAYGRWIRTRDPGIVLPAGLVSTPTVWTSSSKTIVKTDFGTPKLSFNYNGHVYFICANGDVLKSVNGVGDPYRVTNLLEANALKVYSEAGAGSKTAARSSYPTAFDPATIVQYNGAFILSSRSWLSRLLYFDGADENGVVDDTAWFLSTAIGGPACSPYWVVNNKGHDYFVCRSGRSQISFTYANPMLTANMGAAYPIGDINGPSAIFQITNLISSGRVAYVLKEDGLYSFDENAHSPCLTTYAKVAIHPDNGKVAHMHGNYLYAAHRQGLIRYDTRSRDIQDIGGFCTPGKGLPNETPIAGNILALVSDRDWLGCVIANGATWYLGYGREAGPSEAGPLVWHFAEAEGPGDVTMLHLGMVSTSSDAPRMWIGGGPRGGGTPFLHFQYLSLYDTALQDIITAGPMRFSTYAELYLPIDAFGDSNALKNLIEADIQAEELELPWKSIDYQLRMDSRQEADWGEVGLASSEGQTVMVPSLGQIGGFLIHQRLIFNGQIDAPPRLRAFRGRFGIAPEAIETRTYQLKIGEGVTIANGNRESASLLREWNQIRRTLAQAGRLELYDAIFGETMIAKVEGELKATPLRKGDGNWVGMVAQVEVSVYGRGRGARYDDGGVSGYDDGARVGD